MNRALRALLLCLVPLTLLVSCSVGGAVRRGAEDAQAWYETGGGKEKVATLAHDLATAVTDAARVKLQAEWDARMVALKKEVDEGTASPWQIALYILLGGGGSGAIGKLLEKYLIGVRGPANGGAPAQP